MADLKPISAFNAASAVDANTLFLVSTPNGADYDSENASAALVADAVVNDFEYTQDLSTVDKTISGAINENKAVIGYSYDEYDDTTAYSTGDLCIYNNVLYKAKQATTGNLPTNTTYWEQTSIADEIGRIDTALSNVSDYSTTEKTVGKWIDGKTIYRKVLTDNITQGSYLTINLGEYTDTITKIEVIISKPSTNIWLSCPFRNEVGNDYYQGYLFVNQSIPKNSNTTTINVLCESSSSGYFDNCVAQIVIEYTKP